MVCPIFCTSLSVSVAQLSLSSDKLDGNITVLLTLAFFSEVFSYGLQYAQSFNYRLNGSTHEMDFGIIASEWLRSDVDLIFGAAGHTLCLQGDPPVAKPGCDPCLTVRWHPRQRLAW